MSDVPMVQHALLLRVPPTIADSVRKQLGEKQLTGGVKDASGGGSMRITFTTQEGQMQMQMGTNGATLQGQLVNLPSIIEVQKTFDQIHYYKVADIGQMVVVQSPSVGSSGASGSTASLNSNPARPKNATADTSQQLPPIDYPSGLTPPTRDIRSKRYERATKVPYRIVKEVDSLLANLRDEKAVHTFELVEEEEEVEIDDEEDEGEEVIEEMDIETGEVSQSTPMDTDVRLSSRGQTDDRPPSGRPLSGRPPTGYTGSQTGARSSNVLQTPATAVRLASPTVQTPQFDRSGPAAMTQKRPMTEDHHKSMFGMSPQVHTDMLDPTDSVGPSSTPALSGINVDGVEGMFGSPAVAVGSAGGSGGGSASGSMDFLPETPHTPVVTGALPPFPPVHGFAPSPSPPPPPSALDLLRVDLSDVDSRVEKAQKLVTEAKNLILKKQAQQKLDAVLAEKATIEAKIAAAATTSDANAMNTS